MLMIGMAITFTKQVASGTDQFNDPTYSTEDITIEDCLVGPMTEPLTARENQALQQARDQVRVHLPKTNTEDIADSTFVYDGKTFTVDSSGVKLMDGNTPTRWNKYFRAECVNG